jgi:predicted CoA-binding protein
MPYDLTPRAAVMERSVRGRADFPRGVSDMPDDDACPLPTPPEDEERSPMRRMLAARRIAIVGLSDDPSRPSYGVAGYLRSVGKEVVPVNPNHKSVMGITCYPSLADVPGRIDLVNVFRRPEHCAGVVEEAVAVGAKGVWLQSGITSVEGERLAREAGLDYVQNRCLMVEHMHQGRRP